MIVYHGSNCIVSEPNIKFSRDALDFGKGFYVINIKNQALEWTKKFKTRGEKAYLNIYEFKMQKANEEYKIKEFLEHDDEWLQFIIDCRSGSDRYLEYDVLIGGIADDRVYNTLELYEDNLISREEALKRLKFYKPNNQICMVNQGLIETTLKYIESKEV